MAELPEAKNDYERGILSAIDDSGYFLVGVLHETKENACFLYSVGLHHKFDHPEFLVIGLHRDMAKHVGVKLGDRIADGERYAHGDIVDDLIPGYLCKFLDIPPVLTTDWMLSDNWFYGPQNYPAMQLVFQDEGHHWPWDDAAPIHFLLNQPILGKARM